MKGEVTKQWIASVVSLITIIVLGNLWMSSLGGIIQEAGADSTNDFFNYIQIKVYDENKVLEFIYKGEEVRGESELRSASKEDLWVTVVGANGEKINYTFTKDVEALEIIQIDIPDDFKNVVLYYRGEAYFR